MLRCAKCGLESGSTADFFESGRTVEILCLACGGPSSFEQSDELATQKLPFSFGALGLPSLWLLLHGEMIPGACVVVLNLLSRLFPIAALPVLCIAVYYGFRGSRVAVRYTGYRTIPELRRGERPWTILGWVALVFQIGALIYIFVKAFLEAARTL